MLSIVAAGVRRMSAMDKIEEISFYFNLGMNYNDMLKSLAVRQGVIISKRHLIRLLKMHGYSRRQYDDLSDVILNHATAEGKWKPAWIQMDVQQMHEIINYHLASLQMIIISGILIHMINENHMESASMVA